MADWSAGDDRADRGWRDSAEGDTHTQVRMSAHYGGAHWHLQKGEDRDAWSSCQVMLLFNAHTRV